MKMTQNMLIQFGTNRYIANLGHGIYPNMDPASVEIFVDAVHSISKEMIAQQQ